MKDISLDKILDGSNVDKVIHETFGGVLGMQVQAFLIVVVVLVCLGCFATKLGMGAIFGVIVVSLFAVRMIVLGTG